MKKIMQTIIILGISAMLFSCTTTNEHDGKSYHGSYVAGFEASSFTVEGSKEKWWLSFAKGVDTSPVKPKIDSNGRYAYTTYHITVKGRVSKKGNYGHMGMYQREIEVAEIIEVEAE